MNGLYIECQATVREWWRKRDEVDNFITGNLDLVSDAGVEPYKAKWDVHSMLELGKTYNIKGHLIRVFMEHPSPNDYILIDEVEEVTGESPYKVGMNIYTNMNPYMQEYLYDMQNEDEKRAKSEKINKLIRKVNK